MRQNAIIERIKDYPIAVLCLVVSLVCAVLIFLRGDAVPTLQVLETDLNSRISVIEQNKLSSDGLDQDVERLNTAVAELENRLFDPSQRAINTNFFYSFEDRVKVLITGVREVAAEDPVLAAGGPNELKMYSALVYELNVESSYKEFLKLLNEISSVEPLMRVAAFQVSSAKGARTAAQDASKDDQVTAQLRILVLSEKI